MGMDDRDEAYRSRGQSPRRRPYDGDPRDMSGPRSRPPRRDYDDDDSAGAARGAPNRYTRDEYDRRGPSGASSSSGRRRNDDYDNGYANADRLPRPSRSDPRAPRRSPDGYDRFESNPRSTRSDPSGSSPRGDRAMRGPRPPARDDGWSEQRPARAGVRSGAGDSSGRMRRAAPPPGRAGRGGLWDDEPAMGLAGRDARARYLQNQAAEEDEESPGSGFAKALGVIVLAFVLGAGSAFGYSLVSAPHLHTQPGQIVTPTSAASTPSTTPSPSPTK